LGSREYFRSFQVRLGLMALMRGSVSARLAWMPPPYEPPVVPTTAPLASFFTYGLVSRTFVMSCRASFTS